MLYNPRTTLNQALSGRNLAHCVRSASQRAGVAAELVVGTVTLVKPTIKQAAKLCGVSAPYVKIALTSPRLTELAAGDVTITDLLKPSNPDQLVQAWNAATNTERVEFVQRIGVGRVWDEALAPAIG